MADSGRMIFLGFGKYARADKIYAVEPITGKDRGGGQRTRVWIEGVGLQPTQRPVEDLSDEKRDR